MDVTVIVSTRNRAASLQVLLDDLARQMTTAEWELLVVDNGCTDETCAVLKRACVPSLRTISEPRQGKSRALNRALDSSPGDLVIFTDDDVVLERDWIEAYRSTSAQHRNQGVFCGPIVPVFPPFSPAWLGNSGFAGAAFAHFDSGAAEALLPPSLVPFGPNVAVRRDAIGTHRFRLDLGPSEAGNLMCEDVEFVRRVAGPAGRTMFIRSAGVRHVLREEMTLSSYQFERAFNLGRSKVIMHDRLDIGRSYRVPYSSGYSPLRYFDMGFALNAHYGQLSELVRRGRDAECAVVHLVIRGMGWHGEPDLQSESLTTFLREHPRFAPWSPAGCFRDA